MRSALLTKWSPKKHMQLRTGLAIHLTIYSWKFPWKMFPHKKMPYKTWMKKYCAHLKWKRPGVLAVLVASSWSIHPRGPKIGYLPTQPLFSIIMCIHRSIQKTPFPKKEQKISKHGDHHPNVNKKDGRKWKKSRSYKKNRIIMVHPFFFCENLCAHVTCLVQSLYNMLQLCHWMSLESLALLFFPTT